MYYSFNASELSSNVFFSLCIYYLPAILRNSYTYINARQVYFFTGLFFTFYIYLQRSIYHTGLLLHRSTCYTGLPATQVYFPHRTTSHTGLFSTHNYQAHRPIFHTGLPATQVYFHTGLLVTQDYQPHSTIFHTGLLDIQVYWPRGSIYIKPFFFYTSLLATQV